MKNSVVVNIDMDAVLSDYKFSKDLFSKLDEEGKRLRIQADRESKLNELLDSEDKGV